MNTFDKIKVVSNIKYISYINRNVFTKKMRNGRISSWQYTTNDPYNLMIEKNKDRNELVIEFTGKILAQFNSSVDAYPVTTAENSAQTIHEEWDISYPMYLCPKAFDLRVQRFCGGI